MSSQTDAVDTKASQPRKGKKSRTDQTLDAAKGSKGKTKKPSRPRSKYTKAELHTIFARLAHANPAPESDLQYQDPYTLLVAVVLSAQATDAGVNKATAKLYAEASTPAAMVALGEARVMELIKTIGLYRNKAKNVILLSQMLLDNHDGEVPADRDALQALPGVGRKTANVVMNVAFGATTIAVDTHIFRVANRMGMAPGKTPDDVEAHLERVVPEEFLLNAHHWLILHGRYTCKARKPDCDACLLYDLCKSPEKRPREIPVTD